VGVWGGGGGCVCVWGVVGWGGWDIGGDAGCVGEGANQSGKKLPSLDHARMERKKPQEL